MEMGTRPVREHEWLQNLVGEWRVETEMTMPDGAKEIARGTETSRNLGGLWAVSEGIGTMPGGVKMDYRSGLGYDVSFKEYRGFWIGSVSSHLWKYTGELSADGRVMTLNCVGPHMEKDGETANYRDEDGQWQQFMKAHYYRV